MSKFRTIVENILKEGSTDSSYNEYTAYVHEELAKQNPHILDFEAWRMQNDEDYRDDVLDNDSYYQDAPADATDQERFDDTMDMYDIAGING